jgi:hypothetical protein
MDYRLAPAEHYDKAMELLEPLDAREAVTGKRGDYYGDRLEAIVHLLAALVRLKMQE